MSTDAIYILAYNGLNYFEPTPMRRDMNYLKDKFGGLFSEISDCSILWDKPKYTLPTEELQNLLADQVLERRDCELWEIIK